MHDMPTDQKQEIAKALGLIPSGCFILTAGDASEATGILASWVQQAGFDPPAVTVAVKHERDILPLIEKTKHFVLNIISDQQTSSEVFKRFAKGFDQGESAFEGLEIDHQPSGVVIKDCLGHLGCKLIGKVAAGDHTIYVGAVVGAAVHTEGDPAVRIRSHGFNY
jgi:flavin reductase (DIM6/NTAB) family NADH-FMN oxidoreductase RutF